MMVAAAANGNTTSTAGHDVISTAFTCSSSTTNTAATVPPGFRFHPTDEELLYYYLRKKVSYEAIDLDVIREVDLNKLEPWDLKDKCRIGSGPQNEWYLFSHKDKKYPTGTRTNRATAVGFWKATGRDKAIHHSSSANSTRIGMRKTLVFYIGRAPHGHKTDWIMHEYRLDDENALSKMNHPHRHHELEDGWVVCRVFKKKAGSITRGFQQPADDNHDQVLNINQEESFSRLTRHSLVEPKQNSQTQALYDYFDTTNSLVDGRSTTMHLPQLLSPESMSSAAGHAPHPPSFLSGSLDDIHYYCSQNLLSLASGSSSGNSGGIFGRSAQHDEKLMLNGDWSFLDKLLASHQSFDEQTKAHSSSPQQSAHDLVPSTQRFPLIPFQYSEHAAAGCFKYCK